MHDTKLDRPASRFDHRWKAAMLVAIIVAMAVVALTVDIPDPQPLRDRVDAAGAWGVLVFVLLYVAVSLTPFPATALTIAAGLLFGLVDGAIVVVVAATLGALLGFALARWLGREGVARLGWERMASIDAVLARRGMLSVFLIRLIPLPFALVNYAAGLSALRPRDYLVGTVVGILPASIGYTALGAYGTSPLSWPFVGAVTAVVLIAVASGLVAKRLRRSDPAVTDEVRTPSTPGGDDSCAFVDP